MISKLQKGSGSSGQEKSMTGSTWSGCFMTWAKWWLCVLGSWRVHVPDAEVQRMHPSRMWPQHDQASFLLSLARQTRLHPLGVPWGCRDLEMGEGVQQVWSVLEGWCHSRCWRLETLLYLSPEEVQHWRQAEVVDSGVSKVRPLSSPVWLEWFRYVSRFAGWDKLPRMFLDQCCRVVPGLPGFNSAKAWSFCQRSTCPRQAAGIQNVIHVQCFVKCPRMGVVGLGRIERQWPVVIGPAVLDFSLRPLYCLDGPQATEFDAQKTRITNWLILEASALWFKLKFNRTFATDQDLLATWSDLKLYKASMQFFARKDWRSDDHVARIRGLFFQTLSDLVLQARAEWRRHGWTNAFYVWDLLTSKKEPEDSVSHGSTWVNLYTGIAWYSHSMV